MCSEMNPESTPGKIKGDVSLGAEPVMGFESWTLLLPLGWLEKIQRLVNDGRSGLFPKNAHDDSPFPN
jgi:hypothetical protein